MGNEQPNKITIQVGNAKREVTAPAGWNALERRKLFLYYATLFPSWWDEYTASAVTMVKVISMAQDILGVDAGFLAQWEADCLKQDPEHGEITFLAELKTIVTNTLVGLFEVKEDADTGNTTYACRLNLTVNPFPRLEHTTGKGKARKTTVFLCAEDGLANITIYELATTFTYFEQYLATQDEAWADKLVATLYRPQKPISKQGEASGYEGDRRQPLRRYEKKVAEREVIVATLQPLVKRLIVFWFASCRQEIVDRYGKVFKKGGGEGAGYGWGGVLLAIAGGPAGLDAIADQHYSNSLTWLAMKEDEREAMEAKMRK